MAVVSISRIQIRRGKKNTGSGLPQLASGELGWAIDTQELYIGNGSVAEGAPYVGNTKLLSEHDDLFQFADTYSYKSIDGYVQTGDSPNNPVLRTLQDRLDDRVSIRAFGATGDGTDQTAAFQRAIDQLYLNAANKGTEQSRVELIIEPGVYRITSTIYLPPFVTIRGAGSNKTIIQSTTNTVFQTVNETSTVGNYANDSTTTTLNQPRNITVSGLSIVTQNGIAFDLRQIKDSVFEDISIQGVWSSSIDENGDGNWDRTDLPDKTKPAIKLSHAPTTAICSNNVFENIKIKNYSHGVITNDSIQDNTWNNCLFDTVYIAFAFGEDTILGTAGQGTGPSNNIISNSVFDDVWQSAIVVWNGNFNLSKSNKFYNVGNEGGSSGNAKWPIIRFDTPTNQSAMDWFKRTEELSYSPTFLVNYPYTPEISGPTIASVGYTQQINLSEAGEFTKLLKLPADSVRAYTIEYIYKSTVVQAYRSGRIEIIVDPSTGSAVMSDEYDYAGDTAYEDTLEFIADTYDENNDGTVDTVALMVLNSVSGEDSTLADDATLTFNIKSKA